MNAIILAEAEADLERAFDHYQTQRRDLGVEFLEEFRRGLDLMTEHPRAWQPLDEVYRRCRLHRFPYGIVYRIDEVEAQMVIVAVMHLSEQPDNWRARDQT